MLQALAIFLWVNFQFMTLHPIFIFSFHMDKLGDLKEILVFWVGECITGTNMEFEKIYGKELQISGILEAH